MPWSSKEICWSLCFKWLLKELTESIKIISWKVEKLEEKVDAVAEAEGESQQQEESVEKTEKDSFQWW